MQRSVKQSTMIEVVSSILVGICSIAILLLTSKTDLKNDNIASLWFLACIYLVVFNYFAFWKYDIKYLKKSDRMKTALMYSVFLTIVLFLLLPFGYGRVLQENYFMQNYLNNQTITIAPVSGDGTSNSQIWVEGIKVDEEDYNLYDIALADGWEFREDRPYTDKLDAEPLSFKLNATNSYAVMVRKGPEAGRAQITIGENSAVFDFYQEEFEQRAEIDIRTIFSQGTEVDGDRIQNMCYNVVYIAILWEISLTFVIWLFSILVREKILKEKG